MMGERITQDFVEKPGGCAQALHHQELSRHRCTPSSKVTWHVGSLQIKLEI